MDKSNSIVYRCPLSWSPDFAESHMVCEFASSSTIAQEQLYVSITITHDLMHQRLQAHSLNSDPTKDQSSLPMLLLPMWYSTDTCTSLWSKHDGYTCRLCCTQWVVSCHGAQYELLCACMHSFVVLQGIGNNEKLRKSWHRISANCTIAHVFIILAGFKFGWSRWWP